jgi:type I restriction enzyme S subunit
MVPLGEIAEQIERPEQVLPDKSYTLLGMRSQIGGPFARETKLGRESSAKQLNRVEAGDFIYSRLFAWQGSFGIIPGSLSNCYVSNEFPLFRIDRTRAVPNYILYWFGLPETWRRVEIDCYGSTPGTRNRFKEKYFLNLRAPLPPLDEQRRIVARLGRIADRIEARRERVTQAEADLQSLLSKAFAHAIDGAPRRPMAEVAPLVRRPVEIEPTQQYTEIGVRSFYNGIFHRRTMPGSDFTWQKLFRIKEGDLVFSNLMAWEQAIAVAGPKDHDTVGNHRMLSCAVNPDLATPDFLMAYFRTPEGFASVVGHSPGSIARNKTLSSKKLPSIQVPIPPLETQRWFDRVQAKARQIRAIRQRTAEDADALIPALLHEIFNGPGQAA